MKRTIKYIILAILVISIVMTAILATGCNKKNVIGVIQFGTHESLNDCYEGMVQGLKEGLGEDFGKYKIELQNSNFDPSTSATQANAFVNSQVAIVGAIATSSAIAAANAAKGSIPVVYCAVSDPSQGGLNDMENVTGSADLLDFESQIKLIQAFIPSVDKIGVMYTTTEQNSISQVAQLKTIANKKGITIVEKSVTNANEIPAACNALLQTEGLDCITNLTDNTVVGSLETILEKASEKGIPVFGSEIRQVEAGCLASASLDYVALGKVTGLLMAKILKGEEKASNANAIAFKESELYYSKTVAAKLGIKAPELENMKSVD